MATGRRIIWIPAMVFFLFTSCGCAATSKIPVGEGIAREGSGLHTIGQPITGYQLSDGTRVDYKGMVRFSGADSLEFWVEGKDMGEDWNAWVPGPKYAIEDIAVLEMDGGTHAGKTTGLVFGLIILAAGVAALIMAATVTLL